MSRAVNVFDWPADGKLVLGGLQSKVKKAFLLANKKSLKSSSDENGVIIEVPEEAPDAIDTVIVLTVKGPIETKNPSPVDAD